MIKSNNFKHIMCCVFVLNLFSIEIYDWKEVRRQHCKDFAKKNETMKV